MYMLSELAILPSELAQGSDRRIDSLRILTPAEERQLLNDWNATQQDYPAQDCIHHLFERQVSCTPNATAVNFGHQKLTYRELDVCANHLAHRLQALGAGPEVLVGVCIERSLGMVVALLAVLKAGAAYVPLDPSHPLERLIFMSRDAGIGLLLAEERFVNLLPIPRDRVVLLDTDWNQLKLERDLLVQSTACPGNLAYVIYTSGSTGQPHGVMIEHRSVVNFLTSMQTKPGLHPSDRMLSVTTICFDIAALEIFLPLTVGAELFIANREVITNGARLGEEISRRAISVMQATPSTWRMLVDSQWAGEPQLKALCGGEALSRELANELTRRTNSLWNLYGPTETTIWSTAIRVEAEQGPVLIGHPIANTRVYILDEQRRPVPIGVPGEIYIAGDGVARGYWNRRDLTAHKFVELPFETGRAYKTGDIGRYRNNGGIEYLARLDFQMKLRGYRIELAEIESALRGVNGVKEAVIAAREHNGEKRLIAYLESEADDIPTAERTRSHLKESLPEYMLPSDYVVMERLPLTPNGKIDRNALPEPRPRRVAENEFIAPRDRFERQLAAIWEEVLAIKPIGIAQNFFELGGHSLLAARLVSRIEKATGHNLPVAALFRFPTVELLSNAIQNQTWETSWSPVVELQHGSRSPFFCVHSLGANLVSYQKLATVSGPDQQFYGLQPYGLDGKHEPQACIEDMARSYLNEIRRIQPKGPYRIGGVCLGGLVSFEMAQQLNADGEEVSLLLLIDCEFPAVPEHLHIRAERLRWADRHLGELLRLPLAKKARYIGWKTRDAALRIGKNALPGKLSGRNESSLTRATRRVMEVNLGAALSYSPRTYSGRVTLFCCSEKSTRSYEDRRLAWSQVAAGGLEVHLIPGNHLSMLDHPHVQVMGDKLRSCLERARD
jgi:amino acid adenylation domain-containing protein